MRDLSLNSPPEALPRHTFLVHGDTRCVSGDAFIGYQVRRKDGTKQNDKGGTLAHLYRRFHRIPTPGKGYKQRAQTVESDFWCPAMTEDGRLFQNKITDVIDSGVRDCVRVRTVAGRELICTADHPIANESRLGFIAAGELSAGAEVLVHSHTAWTSKDSDREQPHRVWLNVKHHPVAGRHVVSSASSRSGEYVYFRLARARAVIEASMNGLTYDAYVERLDTNQLDGLIFLRRDQHVHHRNEDRTDDALDNLEVLSHAEHSREHFVLANGRPRAGSYVATLDVVSSVEPAGRQQTYDIKMTAPWHNFVANDFIVHNSGKTEFGASFPRPLIIADTIEGGWKTVSTMDRSKWFEPEREPIVKGIENLNDLTALMPVMDQLISQGLVCSVIFDAFSFYVDFFLRGVLNAMAKPDNRQAYGILGNHLVNVRSDLHSRPVNVVWNALCKHPDEDDPKGRPMIPGKQGDKFSAGVDFLFHSRVEQKKEGGKIVRTEYQLRTQQFNAYIAGNRLGASADLLPDPFSGTYAEMMALLGYDIEKIRANLPTPGVLKAGAKIAGAAAKAAAPPAKPAPKGLQFTTTAK